MENRYHTIMLTMILINRTKKTLQNILVDMYIKEDVKVTDRPPIFNLAPQQIKTLKMMFKANKTEEGFLFGYISYSSSSGNVPYLITLDHIALNFLDTIVPEKVTQKTFKKLWTDLVWENKFQFPKKDGSLYAYLMLIAETLNLAIVSPLTQFDKTSSLLVANMFGRSKFGTFSLKHFLR